MVNCIIVLLPVRNIKIGFHLNLSHGSSQPSIFMLIMKSNTQVPKYICNSISNKTNILFLTLNCKGQQNEVKRKKQYIWAQEAKADVLFLQETHSSYQSENVWRNQWGGETAYFSHGETNSKGVSIHFRRGLDIKLLENFSDPEGRFLWLKIIIQNSTYGLLNIYAPNSENDQIIFYEKIYNFLHSKKEKHAHFIIGGDFNVVRNSKDKEGGNERSRVKVLEVIDRIINDFSLTDIWRAKNPWSKQFTWSQSNPKVSCRLDLWLIPSEFIQIVKNSRILNAISTDHKAVSFKLQGKNFVPRGPGLWKLNTLVLQEKEYEEMITKVITEIIKNNENEDTDPRYHWEEIKYCIRANSINYCQRRANLRREKEKQLRARLQKLEENLHTLDSDIVQEYQLVKTEFERMYQEKTKGAILRSKARWAAQGEKNTKYFFGLEKRNFMSQAITQLDSGNGHLIENSKLIQQMIHDYYKNLYTSKAKDIEQTELDNLFEHIQFPQLKREEQEILNAEIKIEECEKAMREMPDGKSPGEDGLPVEFYKKFWYLLKDVLFNTFEHALSEGELYCSQTRGIIRLVPKPLQNLFLLRNQRPITLLTVDYKILSKVFANRLKKVITSLIDEDQAGFIEKRYIGENIRLLLDLADKMAEQQQPGLCVSLDIEKAFDSLEWPFLFKTLSSFGFSEKFQSWIEVLYTNIKSSVINNGYTTKYFNLERGVRQGDPLSPYLFILAIEVLSILIRNHSEIKGIELNGKTLKLMQYADDTTCFISNKESLSCLKSLLQKFGLLSGLVVNERKTRIIGLGSWKNKFENFNGFRISPEPIKILGIWFCHDKKQMHNLNVGGKIGKIKTILASWHARGLTLQGKILILKTLGLSQLVYNLSNIYVTNETLAEVDKLSFNYIWGGPNKAKIKRQVIIQDYKFGGLKAPDIYSINKKLKISWIDRLLNQTDGKWKNIILDKLEKVGSLDYLLACNFNANKLSVKLNNFWKNVLQSYSELKSNNLNTKEAIREQIINNNGEILIGEKSFFSQELVDKHMDTVGDWFDNSGNPVSFETVKNLRMLNISWLRYLQILSAVPKNWKILLKQRNRSHLVSQNTICSLKNAKNQLIQKQRVEPTAIATWGPLDKPEFFWEKIFILARKMNTDTRLQVFQYKVLHRIIATKEKLFKQKTVNSPFCLDCLNVTETVEHMLMDCPKVKVIWETMAQKFKQMENIEIILNKDSCIFGLLSTNPGIRKWNWLAMQIKFFIYKCRLNSKVPFLPAFEASLQSKFEIMRYSATYSRDTQKFIDTWGAWAM